MKKRVLIVDDSEMVRNFHTYILRSIGLEVETAADGAEALEKLYASEKPWDILVTDINMPNLDGYTLIERLREDGSFDALPVIIVSTEDEIRDKEKGYLAGASLYIVKPTDPDVLAENVLMLLG